MLRERRDVVDSRYLTSIWNGDLCIRYCDICKDFRVEIRAIYSRYRLPGLERLLIDVLRITKLTRYIPKIYGPLS
jgi:hypothetical protein